MALAHHSTAMFEPEKRVTLKGTVKEFQWTNPHSWIQVTIVGTDGKAADWSFEGGSPNTLARQGWKPSTLQMGDEITVVANPMKDGTHAGLMYTVTLADGRVLGPGAPAETAAAPAASRPAVQSLTKAADLPDWSGAWTRATGQFYESTPEQALEPAPPADSPRRHPPYTPKFEQLYQENLRRIAADRFPDPISVCGTPAGWPRMLALPDAYEFVIRPEQTWILSENGPNTMRIYTDGRAHRAREDFRSTFTGNSVGRWERDELVFETVGLKGVGSTILARTGLIMSDKLETTTRIRLLDSNRLLVTVVLEDAEALTRPWPVAFTYTRLPAGSTVDDYACAENNRNPVTGDGRTLTLDPSGRIIDKLE